MGERKRIRIWGTGLKEKAEPTTPEQLEKNWPGGAPDLRDLGPWHPDAFDFEGQASQWWASSGPDPDLNLILAGPCTSVMDLAWHLIQNQMLDSWGSILCPSQRAGRGQMGRAWISPAGNVYAALRLPNPDHAWPASLAVGYALVRAFGAQGISVKLKWPNDLVMDCKKIGGILVEERGGIILAGIGLNLVSCPGAEQLRHDQVIPAASLLDFGHEFRPISLWLGLMGEIRACLEQSLGQDSVSELMARVKPFLAFAGEEVCISGQDPSAWTVLGLAMDGGLELGRGQEKQTLYSGSFTPLRD